MKKKIKKHSHNMKILAVILLLLVFSIFTVIYPFTKEALMSTNMSVANESVIYLEDVAGEAEQQQEATELIGETNPNVPIGMGAAGGSITGMAEDGTATSQAAYPTKVGSTSIMAGKLTSVGDISK